MEQAFALLNAVLEASERNMTALAMKKHVEKSKVMFEKKKLSPLSKTRLNEIIGTFLSNEDRLFKLGVATREVKNELSHEEQSLRALRQDYKEFTEGKDGSTMSALQEKFELLNGKKET